MSEKRNDVNLQMQEVARTICSRPLPQTEMLRTRLYQTLLKERGLVIQERITTAMRGFADYIEACMPDPLVAAYIERQCNEDLPATMEMASPGMMFPGWTKGKDEFIAPDATAAERSGKLVKFRQDEVFRYLEASAACPALSFACLAFQQLLHRYIGDLSRITASIQPEQADALRDFQGHFTATNITRFLGPALVKALPPSQKFEDAVHLMDQATVKKAFAFLEESLAFNFKIPAYIHQLIMGQRMGQDIVISCPAHLLLRRLMVDHGTFLRVAHAVDARSNRPLDPFLTALVETQLDKDDLDFLLAHFHDPFFEDRFSNQLLREHLRTMALQRTLETIRLLCIQGRLFAEYDEAGYETMMDKNFDGSVA